MRFLADENVPSVLVAWLRSNLHDVLYAAEESPGEQDDQWLRRAESEQRVIFTADKDFGGLVFKDKLSTHGVILLRLFNLTVAERIVRLAEIWDVIEQHPTGFFIVVSEDRIRVKSL